MPRRRLKDMASDERGFTLIELLVTIMVVTIGFFAVLEATVRSGTLTYGSQRVEQANLYAQSQVEQMRSIPYNALAMTTNILPNCSCPGSNPGTTGNASGDQYGNIPSNPNYYVKKCFVGAGLQWGLNIQMTFRRLSGDDAPKGWTPGSDCEPFVATVPAGYTPAVNPGPTTINFTNGISGQLYRYVTYHGDGCVSNVSGVCLGYAAEKRVTVAVVLNSAANGAGPYKPIWSTSIVANPNAKPLNLP